MNNVIGYLYGINVIKMQNDSEDNYIIKSDKSLYILRKINSLDLFKFVCNSVNKLNIYGFYSYRICQNIYHEYFSKLDGSIYAMVDVGDKSNNNVDFFDMLDFYKKSSMYLKDKIKYTNMWDVLWEGKIDYLTIHFDSNIYSNRNVKSLFWYYVGMAENALLYIKKTKKSIPFNSINDNVSFVHRRIFSSNIKFDFYNPLNFILDLEVRDIAEYVKSLYYSKQDYIYDLEYYLKTHTISKYCASFLYARIVYPSYFFDSYETGNLPHLISTFSDISGYEDFIKKTYDIINSYVSIKKISWL